MFTLLSYSLYHIYALKLIHAQSVIIGNIFSLFFIIIHTLNYLWNSWWNNCERIMITRNEAEKKHFLISLLIFMCAVNQDDHLCLSTVLLCLCIFAQIGMTGEFNEYSILTWVLPIRIKEVLVNYELMELVCFFFLCYIAWNNFSLTTVAGIRFFSLLVNLFLMYHFDICKHSYLYIYILILFRSM